MKAFIGSCCFVIVLLLSACGDTGIQQGYVYGKHYYPGYSTYVPGSTSEVCASINEIVPVEPHIEEPVVPHEEQPPHEVSCHSVYHPGFFVSHPARWTLDISSCRRNHQSSECKNNTIDVSQGQYDHFGQGSYFK